LNYDGEQSKGNCGEVGEKVCHKSKTDLRKQHDNWVEVGKTLEERLLEGGRESFKRKIFGLKRSN
jgi:hypothetical protein